MFQNTPLRTPLLVNATLTLVAINFAIVLWLCLFPNINPAARLKPPPQSYDVLADKGSPFEPDRIEIKRKSAKLPKKLEPVVAQIIPEATIPPSGSDN